MNKDKLLSKFADVYAPAAPDSDVFWIDDTDVAAVSFGYFFRDDDMLFALKHNIDKSVLLAFHEYGCEHESNLSLQDYIDL